MLFLPLRARIKEKEKEGLACETKKKLALQPNFNMARHVDTALKKLEVGSPIKIPSRYGTIKWIGLLPNIQDEIAGIELVFKIKISQLQVWFRLLVLNSNLDIC